MAEIRRELPPSWPTPVLTDASAKEIADTWARDGEVVCQAMHRAGDRLRWWRRVADGG